MWLAAGCLVKVKCGVSCSGVVLQVLFHPKQLMLVTSGEDADVRVWDLVSKSCVAVLKVHFCSLLLSLHSTRLSVACWQVDSISALLQRKMRGPNH